MKKILLFLMFALLCIPWATNAQTTVEIGDGTTAGYYTPIGTYYNYSITEQLYTAEEIGAAGTITSISFYYAYSAAKELPITVYMANVDAADLSTGISLADADEVFNGTLSVTAAGWATIDLDAPFAYDGTSNLLIGINKGYCQWFSGSTWNYTEVANMARYSQNDNNAYDLSTVPDNTTNNRPNIQLTIVAGGVTVCEKPATMEASNVTSNSAVLNWTGGSGTYNVEYMGGDVTEWTSYLTNTTATSANLSGLNPGTNYQYRVQSVCTDGVSGWKSVSFSTMFGVPFVENFGTSIPSGWSIDTGLLATVLEDPTALGPYSYGWNFGENNGVFDNHARVNIYGTSCKYWLLLPSLLMENNVQLMFDVAYTAYSGTGAPATTGTDDKFVVLIKDNSGWNILRQWDNAGSEYVLNDLNTTPVTVTFDLSSYAGQNVIVAFYGESTESNADNNLHIDNVSIDYIPACPKPTGLAVNYENGTEATVTWEGDAAGYELDVNGTTYTTTDNTYSLTGLELATDYEVKVRANCGANGYSDWTNTASFTTDACMPEDQCSLTFVLADSYGDSWNGASIGVYDYTGEELGDLLASVTIATGLGADVEQTTTLTFCNGQELAIVWTEGNYDSECSYTITDLNGDVIAENDVELAVAYTIDCTVTDCRRPSDFVAGNIGGHSVELSWTENGPATEWVIAYISENDEDITEITVTTNPYTLTGLTPETAYAAQVTPVCEVEKPSEVIYWTTDVACPAPTELVVNPLVTSAEISWNGFAETYDLEWAPKPTSTVEGSWLQYDNGTMQANVGSATAGVWTWGVKYPSTMLNSNNTLSKIAFYEVGNSYYTDGTVTVKIYSGGDSVPATLLYTETIATEGTDGMREVTLSSPVQIDASSNLWITLTANATYCMTMSNQDGGVDSRWFNNSGNWVDFGTLYTAGAAYSFMIRGYIESIDWDAAVWTTESNVTSPTTLNDLSAESEYLVRVKANCGGEDGESIWSQTSFTTASACDAPNSLAAEVEGTTATLRWNAYQDSYTLRYRPASAVDPTAPATIILEANDVWEDGSGYMMLLDADTNTAGVLWNANHYIFVDGEQYSGGDIPASYFDEFEYKIPTGANGSLDDSINVVVTGSVTLQIPAGTYDYVIFNPTPGDRFYIASDNGEVGTAEDNFVFEPGVTYHFTMQRFGNNDGAAFEIIRPMSDWVVVENVTSPYELTGLEPETYYEWYVEGINEDCTDALESEIETFTTGEQSPQTIALQEGTNWVSFYVNVTLDDLKAALVAALPAGNSTAITIQSQDQNVKYQRGRWVGQLAALDMAQMYKITVSSACEVSFEGTPIDPSTLSITINANGNTWIAYPYNQSMTVTALYTGFAENNDQVSSFTQSTKYNRGRWVGQLTTLEAGQGYIYKTEATTPRTFTFPAVSRNVQSR